MTTYVLLIFVFGSVLNVSNAANPPKIPEMVLQKNFGNKCYALFTTRKNYFNAQNHCEMYGGNLATSRSKSINDFLTGIVNEAGINSVWIGLNDWEEEDKYLWSDNIPFKYRTDFHAFHFGDGPLRPTPRGGIKDCITLNNQSDWVDVECESASNSIFDTTKKYICEFCKDNVACNGA